MKKVFSLSLALVVLIGFTSVAFAENDRPRSRSENAREHMSIVATKVEELLEMREDKEGIGQEVREIARGQNDSQVEVDEEFGKLENRSQVMKKLFGNDHRAARNLRRQMEQNNLRIMQLQELASKVKNQADEDKIQEAIQAILNQNIALAEAIQEEEEIRSAFGWLAKLWLGD
ncbi:MAG: hypothetical protein UV74_C0001G0045 [Candidatus Woesebacteria bacterium GW2011_GWB1_43_14]|uniref:DUF5667 domain-containing protein n=1 Tax=Candidatus Woesebacteria bacterium GW2011_GWB1_43_14 TaxID=1618578 RepID=A0A0G1DM24_9BACT|nr:MAG: hypothetical protein UT21_C0003G0014 [Candidatus Woesebacteria bacterium GW2011_GWA1_39_11b]KKS78198.1 MAG: hypothetical protein UV51_C0002G0034 [Candidatus Woesebacteria bacterium GW2011_GWC1_42_9]KKS98935.1 MAG: hypothetical protein UV74_C0001G0045 [Candidatus Woesebacteria bacterium GW2011_GWB1_43_14]